MAASIFPADTRSARTESFPSIPIAKLSGSLTLTQAKTYDAELGKTNTTGNTKRMPGQPYNASTSSRAASSSHLCDGLVVRQPNDQAEGTFYLVHALQPQSELIRSHRKKPIFASGSATKGTHIPGTTSICTPLGRGKEVWLGKKYKNCHKSTEWLKGTEFGFKKPELIWEEAENPDYAYDKKNDLDEKFIDDSQAGL